MSDIGLIGYWKFEDNALDSSGNNNHGTVTGCAYADGKFGRCITINNSGDKIDYGNIFGMNGATELTFLAWIKFNSIEGDYDICSKGIHSSSTPILFWRDEIASLGAQAGNTNCLSVIVYDGDTAPWTSSPSGSMNDTNWHHVGFTFKANTIAGLKIYIDANNSTNCNTTNCNNIASSMAPFIIGTNTEGTFVLNGSIDEVKLYTRTLSQEEIEEEYNKTLEHFTIKNSEKGLIGYWKLEDNAIDDSGNENNGETYNITYSNGKIGRCGNFNGTNSYIETNISSIFNIGTTLTVCAWILRNTNNANYESIVNHIQKTSPYSGYWIGSMSNGKIMAFVGPYTNQVFTTNTISNGEWHHVALISNGTTFAIWIDGNKASEDKSVGTVANDVTIRIGRSILTGEYFDGLIDEVRIYDHAFSQEKIETLYNDTNNTFRLIL